MHDVLIPKVVNKTTPDKSTILEIIWQVCSAMNINFGHLIVWPVGRRLVRITITFQAKQWMPNCNGAIDRSHIYITAPSNNISATDHRNRHISFLIILQGVVDNKCYFMSINTRPPWFLHDSAHFKTTKLYQKVELRIMGGFHDDPLTWPAGLSFPPYIVVDRGNLLLSWCITQYKMASMGLSFSKE